MILLWRMYAKNNGFRFLQIYRKGKTAERLKLTERNSFWGTLNLKFGDWYETTDITPRSRQISIFLKIVKDTLKSEILIELRG